MIPDALREGIDEIARAVDRRALEQSARSLSDRYRAGGTPARRAAKTSAEVAAYLSTRAPATYAAAKNVCDRIRDARPDWHPRSLLDMGAGPGVAAWAAAEIWPSLDSVTLVEAEPAMVTAGRALATCGGESIRTARWLEADAAVAPAAGAELVIVSYLLGELGPQAFATVLGRAWSCASDTLVVLEPGTTAGYERVLRARDVAIGAGGSVLAPCPHDRQCPLPEGDWCHFAVRLARSRTHRLAKDGERGFEDEKLSYVVVCRAREPRPQARVIRRPDLRQGHVVLDLCTDEGLERRTVSRKDGAEYKQARKLAWGDAL